MRDLRRERVHSCGPESIGVEYIMGAPGNIKPVGEWCDNLCDRELGMAGGCLGSARAQGQPDSVSYPVLGMWITRDVGVGFLSLLLCCHVGLSPGIGVLDALNDCLSLGRRRGDTGVRAAEILADWNGFIGVSVRKEKRGDSSGCRRTIIQGEFDDGEFLVPVVARVSKFPKKLFYLLVLTFRGAIRLWVVSSRSPVIDPK